MIMNCIPTYGINGDFKTVEGINVILQSIHVILNTPEGTRIWQPTFGCNLKKYVFDLMDDATISNIKSDIETSLSTWEPRIKVDNVLVDVDNSTDKTINVTITFTYDGVSYSKAFTTSNNSDLTVYDMV